MHASTALITPLQPPSRDPLTLGPLHALRPRLRHPGRPTPLHRRQRRTVQASDALHDILRGEHGNCMCHVQLSKPPRHLRAPISTDLPHVDHLEVEGEEAGAADTLGAVRLHQRPPLHLHGVTAAAVGFRSEGHAHRPQTGEAVDEAADLPGLLGISVAFDSLPGTMQAQEPLRRSAAGYVCNYTFKRASQAPGRSAHARTHLAGEELQVAPRRGGAINVQR